VLARQAQLLNRANGTVLGTLLPGLAVTAGRSQGAWVEVEVEGWIYARSLRDDRRDGHDVAVAPAGGENLRGAPSGTVVGRLRAGALLRRGESRGDWVRVTRRGWVAKETLGGAVPAVAARDTGARPASRGDTLPAPAFPLGGVEPGEGAAVVDLPKGAELLGAPGGGAVGELRPGLRARRLGTAGEWTRIAVEGWVRSDAVVAAGDSTLALSAAELREKPDAYVGRTVEWRVQMIAFRTADELRPELPAGQPYLLARGPLPEAGFVYVMLTREQQAALRGRPPLAEVVVRGTIRAGRGRYLPTPVLELESVREGT